MKDLTHYFTSPSKPTVTITPKQAERNSDEVSNVNSTAEISCVNSTHTLEDEVDKKLSKDVKVLTNIENSTGSKDKHEKQKPRKSKKIKRKRSDPGVKNLTELLSSGLSLISPNSSYTDVPKPENGAQIAGGSKQKLLGKTKNKQHQDKVSSKTEIISSKPHKKETFDSPKMNDVRVIDPVKHDTITDNKQCDDSSREAMKDEEKKQSDKVNAFQFMMDSRNKSIGQNSSGKELSDEDHNTDDEKEIKKKRSSLKNKLQNWADKKGASKRKREEERDEIINHKLKKRAKRLKKLLQRDDLKNDEDFDVVKTKRMKKVSYNSSRSSEVVIKVKETLKQTLPAQIEEDSHDISPKIYKPKETKQGLLNFFEVTNQLRKNEECDILDPPSEKGIIKIKMFTPKTKKLKFRPNLEKNSGDGNIASKDESEFNHSTVLEEESPNKTSKQKKKKKPKHRVKEHSSSDKIKKRDSSSNIDNSILIENQQIATETPSTHKDGKSEVSLPKGPNHDDLKNKHIPNSVYDSVLVDISENDFFDQNGKTPKNKKHKRDSKHKSKTPKIKTDNEVDEENFTPRSMRSWTMRIKINNENAEKEEEKQVAESENVADVKINLRTKRNTLTYLEISSSDENSNDGTSKTAKAKKQKHTFKTDEVVLSSESDDDDEVKKKTRKSTKNKPVKVAPVFVKAAPKPKLDPEVVEARKQFLLSGIPSSLKKVLEKQQSMEDREYDIFPTISHVQQKCDLQPFWTLPEPMLNINKYVPLTIDPNSLQCHALTNSHIPTNLNIQKEVEKVDKLKTLLNKIKADNPNYPVYKSFRLIYEKSGRKIEKKDDKKATPKRKNNRKRCAKSTDKSIEIVDPPKPESDAVEHAMWTEKYKPKCSDDIIGNSDGVQNLRKWLVTWMKFSQEINARKKRRSESTSESEFDTTDCDSRDSSRLPGNTVVLGGPCGSGKSAAVYAICWELGFNIIELNASSKRTGKRLLQELQEATQSHQVRKGEPSSFQNIFPTNKPKEPEPNDQQADKKMCVLLVEDIDIVFEQDDGFISAITQLVTTSKRPIILTTTDYSSIFVQKFLSQYEYISFLPLTSYLLATWLQIVCLVEGLFVNQGDIGALLEFNKGDIRKTLLQLQFWVQSGGQIIRDDMPLRIKNSCSVDDEKLCQDEQQAIPCLEEETDQTFRVHSNCIGSFEIFREQKSYSLPYFLDLGLIWWNIPNILNVSSFAQDRLDKFKETHACEKKDQNKPKRIKSSLMDKMKLSAVEKLYDALAFSDVTFRKIGYVVGNEPNLKNYSSDIKDSLELGERMDHYNGHLEFEHEVTHTLVNGYVEEYNTIEEEQSMLNMAVPERIERRWRAKQHVCEDVFQEALSLSSNIERKSVALDYMPFLRNIARSESYRAATNTKRGNRFRSYLRGLNINYNDSTIKLACKILTADGEF